MELYVLDEYLQKESVIDQFESLIWTERVTSFGDFELNLLLSTSNKNLLKDGTKVCINKSNRVMVVENIEETIDNERRQLLKITGRSLERVLEDRAAFDIWAPAWGNAPVWVISGTPGDICRQIFDTICRNPTGMYLPDKIPYLVEGNFYPDDTIEEESTVIRIELEFTSVYAAIKELCEIYKLGFRLVRDPVTSWLYFNIYAGNDRSGTQHLLDPVIFDTNLDNLTSVKQFSSSSDYKNVAYVINKLNLSWAVYADGVDPSTAGFERRVIIVDASEVEKDILDPDFLDYLTQLGRESLAKHNRVAYLDGEVPSNAYVYDVDYYLNDIVDLVGQDGSRSRMRVVEQIFTDDVNGERSYPTLELDLFVTPGSWYDWPYATDWHNMTGDWDDQ